MNFDVGVKMKCNVTLPSSRYGSRTAVPSVANSNSRAQASLNRGLLKRRPHRFGRPAPRLMPTRPTVTTARRRLPREPLSPRVPALPAPQCPFGARPPSHLCRTPCLPPPPLACSVPAPTPWPTARPRPTAKATQAPPPTSPAWTVVPTCHPCTRSCRAQEVP